MATSLKPRETQAVLPVPEPELTPRELIARARALRPMIQADADAAEERGHYSEALHRAFLEAGLYRTLQPRLFGGYEFSIETFYRAMLEISWGDPGIGWCLTLCASHPFLVASHWPEEAQRDFFADGFFAAPHRPPPLGKAMPAEGGYIVEGQWDYCSGIPWSSHFVGGAIVPDGKEPPTIVNVVLPKSKVTVLDDWGGDRTLGMRSSGSYSVRVDKVFVPAHHAVVAPRMWADGATMKDGTPGTRLHGNPMYLGRVMGPYHMSLVTPVIGAARAALDEFEAIIRTRTTLFPPVVKRVEHPDFQRTYGQALTLTDAAEAILIRTGEMYMDYCARWAETGQVISIEDNLRLWGQMQHAGQLATQAVDLVFNNASSAAAKKGQRIQRYQRDCAMYRSHISSQFLNFAAPIGRVHLGQQPIGLFGL
jgi:3-hydroxy-9,10-secoandrosta-1,3,5(10)-triene-9,17-dione monooxygenase